MSMDLRRGTICQQFPSTASRYAVLGSHFFPCCLHTQFQSDVHGSDHSESEDCSSRLALDHFPELTVESAICTSLLSEGISGLRLNDNDFVNRLNPTVTFSLDFEGLSSWDHMTPEGVTHNFTWDRIDDHPRDEVPCSDFSSVGANSLTFPANNVIGVL